MDIIRASQIGALGRIRELLASGVDKNSRCNYGRTALMLASDRNYVECVQVLLEGGFDVNATDNNKDTALIFAS